MLSHKWRMGRWHQSGFTLIETLVVLSLLSTFFLFASRMQFGNVSEHLESRIFFDQLASQLQYQQALAVLQGRSTLIQLSGSRGQIIFSNDYAEAGNDSLPIPPHLTLIQEGSIRYYASGRVDQFRSFTFIDSARQKEYYLVFQLGNGQFEIKA